LSGSKGPRGMIGPVGHATIDQHIAAYYRLAEQEYALQQLLVKVGRRLRSLGIEPELTAEIERAVDEELVAIGATGKYASKDGTHNPPYFDNGKPARLQGTAVGCLKCRIPWEVMMSADLSYDDHPCGPCHCGKSAWHVFTIDDKEHAVRS
jgi:hypothetical protein